MYLIVSKSSFYASNHVSQGLTSAEIALVVICVLIVVIFLALAAFLYCTGRLIGCCGGVGDNMNKNKKGKGPSSAEARKKAEAEKRLRGIRQVVISLALTKPWPSTSTTHSAWFIYGTYRDRLKSMLQIA